jgi:hypothetical protein
MKGSLQVVKMFGEIICLKQYGGLAQYKIKKRFAGKPMYGTFVSRKGAKRAKNKLFAALLSWRLCVKLFY